MSRLLTPAADRMISADDWFVADHKLQGRPVMPLAAWIAWVQQLIVPASGDVGWEFTDFLVRQPLFFENHGQQSVRCDFQDDDSDGSRFRVILLTRPAGDSPDSHALLEGRSRQPRDSVERLATPVTKTHWTGEEFYRAAGLAGWSYGPAFQLIKRIEFGPEGWRAEIGPPTAAVDSAPSDLTALDAALQGGAVLAADHESTNWAPYRIDLVRVGKHPAVLSPGILIGRWLRISSQERVAQVDCIDAVSGMAVLELRGVHYRRLAETSPPQSNKPAGSVAIGSQNLLAELRQAEITLRPAILTHFIEGQVLDLLRWNESRRKDLARGFVAIGLDSLLAVDLQFRLQTALKFSLPPGTGLNQTTIADVAMFLLKQHPELRA